MKKLIIVLTLALITLSSNFAYSEDSESEKMEADEDYVMSLLSSCKSSAQDDEVAPENLNSYLLTCINNELEQGYYKKITALPKGEDEED